MTTERTLPRLSTFAEIKEGDALVYTPLADAMFTIKTIHPTKDGIFHFTVVSGCPKMCILYPSDPIELYLTDRMVSTWDRIPVVYIHEDEYAGEWTSANQQSYMIVMPLGQILTRVGARQHLSITGAYSVCEASTSILYHPITRKSYEVVKGTSHHPIMNQDGVVVNEDKAAMIYYLVEMDVLDSPRILVRKDLNFDIFYTVALSSDGNQLLDDITRIQKLTSEDNIGNK